MINQNQETEATLDDTRHKIQKEIKKREIEVEKYRENMEFFNNQNKGDSVGQLPIATSIRAIEPEDIGKEATKDLQSNEFIF